MKNHHAHWWVIALVVAGSMLAVTGGAFALSQSTHVTWPAKSTTFAGVNRHLNALHHGMVVNAKYHAKNTVQHAAIAEQMAAYDAKIAALSGKIDDLTKMAAASDAKIVKLDGRIAALETWKANLKDNLGSFGVTVADDGSIKMTHVTPGFYLLLFEKAGAPIFP